MARFDDVCIRVPGSVLKVDVAPEKPHFIRQAIPMDVLSGLALAMVEPCMGEQIMAIRLARARRLESLGLEYADRVSDGRCAGYAQKGKKGRLNN